MIWTPAGMVTTCIAFPIAATVSALRPCRRLPKPCRGAVSSGTGGGPAGAASDGAEGLVEVMARPLSGAYA